MDFVLTKIMQTDWPFFKGLYMNNDVMRFISDPMPEDKIKESFGSRLPSWDIMSPHWLCFVIRDKGDNTPMGLTGLKIVSEGGRRITEVGYMISPEFSGKSLATRSLTRLISLPELAPLNEFCAVVTGGNTASEVVLKKNGFILTEVIENNYVIGNKTFDDHIYTLIR
ncbi:GNAT family N-acetyltransferase [Morganella morganii]|uniref:GNAT family N-acetyltransferase n=1 Tax=Morganella morganii TaxID=582 RepID=UPI0009189AB9|nr:GNAT family protein [Morganella morganii]SHM01203.1 Protein N-acetyltransferase, RimJ/RimL family [Morganella morganii]